VNGVAGGGEGGGVVSLIAIRYSLFRHGDVVSGKREEFNYGENRAGTSSYLETADMGQQYSPDFANGYLELWTFESRLFFNANRCGLLGMTGYVSNRMNHNFQ
jgi:hypothetical protein